MLAPIGPLGRSPARGATLSTRFGRRPRAAPAIPLSPPLTGQQTRLVRCGRAGRLQGWAGGAQAQMAMGLPRSPTGGEPGIVTASARGFTVHAKLQPRHRDVVDGRTSCGVAANVIEAEPGALHRPPAFRHPGPTPLRRRCWRVEQDGEGHLRRHLVDRTRACRIHTSMPIGRGRLASAGVIRCCRSAGRSVCLDSASARSVLGDAAAVGLSVRTDRQVGEPRLNGGPNVADG
jgi:hypothetical protein